MPFYILAWIASLSSGLIIIITKLTSKYSIANPWLFNFLWSLVILLFTIPPASANHAGLPHDWGTLIVAAFFGAAWYICYILAIYRLDVSTLSPLFNFRTIFAVLLGYVLFHERFTGFQFVLFLVIVIAGVFATVDEKMNLRSFLKPSIAIGLSAMLFLAANNALIKMVLVHNDIWTANLWMAIIAQLMLLPTIPLFYKEIKRVKVAQVLPIGAMGVFQIVTNFTANIAYGVNVGITSLIMAVPVSMVMVVLFSIFKPQILEKHTPKIYAIRFTAAVVMIIAAFNLSH